MNILRGTIDRLRDTYAPVSHTSTFRSTGQLTPEEFLTAGDFLVYKFPTWSWSDASDPSKRVAYLPAGKQFLVTRGVPCHRRLAQHFRDGDGEDEKLVNDMLGAGEGEGEEGWLSTGGASAAGERDMKSGDVQALDASGNIAVSDAGVDDEDEIPDMEDEEDDDEAIIRDRAPAAGDGEAARRTYNLYITYTPFYRTPRLYLSGYRSTSEPLPPAKMMEDIAGDYKDKTVTLENFPFVDSGLKMASVHPCKHASVMKVLLDRADAALKLRMQRIREGKASAGDRIEGMEGLEDALGKLDVAGAGGDSAGEHAAAQAGEKYGKDGDEWEVLDEQGKADEDEVALRVDQYLIVFLKFMASVTPTIEHDFTTSA